MAKSTEEVRWVTPTEAATPSSDMTSDVLSPEDVNTWRNAGYALVNGVLPTELLDVVREEAERVYPPPGSKASGKITDFGSAGHFVFPSAKCEASNAVTLHPRLLKAVSQLLGTPQSNLRLTQSDLWAKYGRTPGAVGKGDNQDQRIHCDYPNHTLVAPPSWDSPEAVEMIIYYDYVDNCGGATAVVPREGQDDFAYEGHTPMKMPGFGSTPWINDKKSAETYLAEHKPEEAAFRRKLYERESRAKYSYGTVLFYRHDTWHRGTPLLPGSRRFVQNVTFRLASAEWVNTLHKGWSWGMYQANQPVERLIAKLSVEQRSVLGFPAPGSNYWTRASLVVVTKRYGPFGFDPMPYAAALDDANSGSSSKL